jgi:ABC-2 type transport system permease protein
MKLFRNIGAVMQKELIQITRDKVALMIAFVAPLLLTVLFGYLYFEQKVTRIPIVIFDRDQTEISRTIIRSFGDSERFKILPLVNNFAAVETAIKTERAFLALVIPPDLQKNIKEGRSAEVGVITNGTNILIMNTAATAANTVIQTISAKITMQVMEGNGVSPQKAYQAITALSFRNRVWYNPTISYLVFMLPGLLGVILQQVTFLGVALSFSKECESGTWRQLMLSGLNWSEFVTGKFIVYFMIYFCDAVLMYLLGFVWFGVPLRGDALLLLALTALFIVVMLAMGMLISILAPTTGQAIEISMVIAVPSFLISGYTWPYLSMIPIVQVLAKIMPLTPFLEAIRAIALYDSGWDVVWGKFAYLALFALISMPIMLVLVKRRLELEDKKIIDG